MVPASRNIVHDWGDAEACAILRVMLCCGPCRNIIHDWGDGEACAILRAVRQAMEGGLQGSQCSAVSAAAEHAQQWQAMEGGLQGSKCSVVSAAAEHAQQWQAMEGSSHGEQCGAAAVGHAQRRRATMAPPVLLIIDLVLPDEGPLEVSQAISDLQASL